MAPAPWCFPFPLPVLSTACGNGNWEVHLTKRHAAGAETGACVADPHPFQDILSFGPAEPILLSRPRNPHAGARSGCQDRPLRAAEGSVLTAASTAAD